MGPIPWSRAIDKCLSMARPRLEPKLTAFDCDGTLWSGDAGRVFLPRGRWTMVWYRTTAVIDGLGRATRTTRRAECSERSNVWRDGGYAPQGTRGSSNPRGNGSLFLKTTWPAESLPETQCAAPQTPHDNRLRVYGPSRRAITGSFDPPCRIS